MTRGASPSEDLLAGRRALELVPGVHLLQDWVWLESKEVWALHITLEAETHSEALVPRRTNWYLLASESYPRGEVRLFPSKAGGLTDTFQHQLHNAIGSEGVPFREGLICTHTQLQHAGRRAHDSEPATAIARLAWHGKRALRWLTDASSGRLSDPGDPFELAHFPSGVAGALIYREGSDTFPIWVNSLRSTGIVEYGSPTLITPNWLVRRFLSLEGQLLLEPKWGAALEAESIEPGLGCWLMFDGPIVLPPWRCPTTWGDLREIAKLQGFKLDDLLRRAVNPLRDGRRHVALFGFPGPEGVGEPNSRTYWHAALLPVLSTEGNYHPGFRNDELGYWMRDLHQGLANHGKIEWLESENWHPQVLKARGSLPKTVADAKIVLIGAGALGSAVGELLVRGGANDITVLDHGTLEAGNLVRHTLSLHSLGKKKAPELAGHLNHISPQVDAIGIAAEFPKLSGDELARVRQAQLVIDTTGADGVLGSLETFDWGGERVFFSASIGLWASRLYLCLSKAHRFPWVDYSQALNPWLERDIAEAGGRILPRAGTSCWSPAFPARADDIWLWAVCAVQLLSAEYQKAPPYRMTVYEREAEGAVRVYPDGKRNGETRAAV